MWTLWALETSMAKLAVRACVLRALVSRKGSGATGVRQAGFTRNGLLDEQSAAATPLSVRAAVSASEDRRLCVTVFRRFCPWFDAAQCAAGAQRDISGMPASAAGRFRQGN